MVTNLEETKEELDSNPDKYVLFYRSERDGWARQGGTSIWTLPEYKLILKEHSSVADAVSENPEVEVLGYYYVANTPQERLVKDFFNQYDCEDGYDYKLKEVD